jgi:protease IV
MAKFFLGVLTGIVVVFLGFLLLVFAVVKLQKQPPSVASNSVLTLRLTGDVPEKPAVEMPDFLGGDSASVTVAGVWMSLRKAAADPRIKAVVVQPEGLSVGWAKLEELRADLAQFRKSGKPVYAYLRSPGTREYYVALAADRIYLGPSETLMLKGLRAESMYFKKTLDKLGVNVEVEHAGKYKDFGDMFTRSDMSAETREVMGSVLDSLYGNLVARIAEGRGKTPEQVRALIDQGPYTPSQALKAGLVDDLRFEDQMWGELQTRVGSGSLRKVTAGVYAKAADTGPLSKSRVALLVASGDIVRGSASDTGEGETMLTSYGFNKLINRVANDSSIKAVVVRIDSPGGEVTASDEIWRQMNLLSKRKPTVISMSDAAASGGYYMAMTGDPIVAYPGTLTGSIGVVFGKPNLRGLYEKLGVSKDGIQRGKNAAIDSDYAPLTPEARTLLRQGVDESYRDFVTKVADARRRKFAEIEPLAQGRVWLGEQAQARGLVDQLGGLDAALELAKQKAKIPASEKVAVDIFPSNVSLFDLILKRANPEDAMETKLTQFFGHTPFHAWMRGGYLRMMPYWVEVR